MGKIVIKLKSNKKLKLKQNNKKSDLCPICEQKMDMCVTSHKNKPFIDNNIYPKMCFTCFSVPKILDQKYDDKGYIKEENVLEYSHKNLHSAENIFKEGSADSLEQAKKCVRSVKNLTVGKEIKNKIKPKLEFYLVD
jgi:hypothetical protein